MVGVSRKTLVKEFVEALFRRSAGVFVGAGLSRAAGFVNWKELLRDVADEIGLSVDRETDLIQVAQFHENERGGRDKLNAAIIDELVKTAVVTESHRLLAILPVDVIWTTNYDDLLEKSFERAGKKIDVKRVVENLSITVPNRDVIIYKMHGDVALPHEAVLTKDDYEQYNDKRSLFAEALQGDLVNRTFLFLGYSFSDPNVAYILARIRSLLGKNRRTHYCLIRQPKESDYAIRDDFIYEECRFGHQVNDLKRYGIQTVAIDDFDEVTVLLKEVHRQHQSKTIFFSGAAARDSEKSLSDLHNLSRQLGSRLALAGYRAVSGVGFGLGGSFVLGAVEGLNNVSESTGWDRLRLRPFPQEIPPDVDRSDFYKEYRRKMIAPAGVGVFVAGNKVDELGNLVESTGMLEEFDILVAQGGYPIPIGASGGASRKLWEKVSNNMQTFFGSIDVRRQLDCLGDATASIESLINAVMKILDGIREPQVSS